MTIFVDNARIPWRGMIMSHLMADDLDELHAFAAELGMKRAWFQDKSVPHYDVSESKRRQAVAMGAVEEDIFSDSMAAFRRAWRIRTKQQGRRVLTGKQHYREKRGNA
jgi:hypothetical protein